MKNSMILILSFAVLVVGIATSERAEAGATTFCHSPSRTPYPLQGPRPTIGCQVDWLGSPASPINIIWYVEYFCVFAGPTPCSQVSVPQSYTYNVAGLTSTGNKKDYPSGNCVDSLIAGVLAALTWQPSSGATGPHVSGDTDVGDVGLSAYCEQPP